MTDVISLSADSIIEEACNTAQLDDFGGYAFREPMEKLLWSLEHEADLNEIGRGIQRQRIVNILVNNLRLVDHLKRYPEILAEVINEPLVIIGLPRTGTTMLHRTIASDKRMFAPLWYENRNPSPFPGWDYIAKDPRITQAEAEIEAMLAGNPELAAAHPMEAEGPDEEILLLEHSFYSTVPESALNVPSYGKWLAAQDQTPGYEFLKLQLQFLQWQKKRSGQHGDRWLLKAPHHLHHLDVLFKVFPDARVIQTHRDPVDTIPSLCSLIFGVWVLTSDNADPCEAGRQWAAKFANGMNHAMAVRETLPEDRFLDLWFKDTVSQPLVEIQKVYDFAGMAFTEDARNAMEAWQEHNRRELRPAHEYTLEQFGLSEEGLKAQYANYRQRYIQSREE